MTDVFAFTGVAGTRVAAAVNELAAHFGNDAEVIPIDEYLWDLFAEDARENLSLLEQTNLSLDQVAVDTRPDWWQLLTLPIAQVRHYWRNAANRAFDRIKASSRPLAFVTLHACYQSDHFRWRLSAVDPSVLQGFGIRAFLCMIDDAYDVLRRRPDTLKTNAAQLRPLAEADKWKCAEALVRLTTEQLDELIRWRQEEIVLSDLFAAACGVSCHVFAMKHPLATLKAFIQDPDSACYFSHPITGIRQLPDFARSEELREITEIAVALRHSLTLIEPTTIDELRIAELERDGLQGTYAPALTTRWPVPSPGALLHVPVPEGRIGEFELLCPMENVEELGLASEFRSLATGDCPDGVSRRVGVSVDWLRDRIVEDVTWRDHHLVDQTRRLVVYRPMYQGRPSTGVRRELEYFGKLSVVGAAVRRTLVYHPEDDERRFAEGWLAEKVVGAWRSDPEIGPAMHPALEGDVWDSVVAGVAGAMQAECDADDRPKVVAEALEEFVRIVPPAPRVVPVGPGAVQATHEAEAALRARIVASARHVMTLEAYLEKVIRQSAPNIVCLGDKQEFLDEATASS